ncbi:acyl-CoA dehydrogenase family protein [Paraburkholderia sp. BCC1886]|uniref:acyl-CoA dehydrogenase family protein n=1 Tax=Paraburkholderia sp. BCC1886 TaxID=2562670 RepID=UPI0011821FD8|nr:acyl-CoA dehydrogenase family protein [Paraburkholderia sp. BCC1886]
MTASSLPPVELADLRALLPWVAEQEAQPDRDTAAFSATMQRLKDARLGALRLPRERGGGGITLTQLFAFVIDLAQADPNVAHAFRNPLNVVETLLIDQSRLPQFVTYLDWIARGETFGASATELGRANVGNLVYQTAVTPGPDGLRLNGQKFYSTGNLYADHIYVYAADAGQRPIKVVVPARRAGVHIADDWDGFGQQFTASGTTTYTNVAVAPEEITDERHVTRLPYFATFAQLYLSAVVAGILQRVVVDAAALLRSRERNFYHAVDEVPADDPLLQSVLGRLESVAHLARVGVLEAAQWLETGFASATAGEVSTHAFEQAAASTAKTKIIVDELALRAGGELFELGGASATRRSQRLDRHWRALRTVTAHNPLVYKALAVGKQVTHGTPLPNLSYF